MNGETLVSDKVYTVGTHEILAAGGDQFTQFSAATSNELMALTFADALLRAFEARELVAGPKVGRYRVVSD